MPKYHLYGHMDRNLIRKGDKVIQYVTPIGTIGDGNGQYYAHLHFSISEGLTPDQLREYISGWSRSKVQQYYRDPHYIDFDKMFGTEVDVGNFGYDFLQWVGYGYHPGVDVNGLKGGNTDFGMPFKASCDGTVIYEVRTWLKNGGWGNLIIVEENLPISDLTSSPSSKLEAWINAGEVHEGWITPEDHNPKYPNGSPSFRNNNPGNFRCSPLIMGELGAIKGVNNLAVFPSYEVGRNAFRQFLIYAATDKLRSYKSTMTLLDFYKVYAPSADSNNPLNYATIIAKALGVPITTQIKFLI